MGNGPPPHTPINRTFGNKRKSDMIYFSIVSEGSWIGPFENVSNMKVFHLPELLEGCTLHIAVCFIIIHSVYPSNFYWFIFLYFLYVWIRFLAEPKGHGIMHIIALAVFCSIPLFCLVIVQFQFLSLIPCLVRYVHSCNEADKSNQNFSQS